MHGTLKKSPQKRLKFPYKFQKEFEDTKGVIRICKAKKNRQHYGKKNQDLQNIQIKLKIE